MPKCGVCGKEFSNDASLAQHLSDKHGGQGGSQETAGVPTVKKDKKSLRKKNRHPVAIGVALGLILLGAGLYYAVAPSFAPTPFPCAVGDTYIHLHPYLRINIMGEGIVIPSNVGDLRQGACLMPIHTHDASGILHVELGPTDKNENFTLSDFFKIWAASPSSVAPKLNGATLPVELTANDILGYHSDATHKVTILVDNATVTDPSTVLLEKLDYCNAAIANIPPCSPTAGGNPYWNGGTSYPYGTGHTIVIEYASNSTA